MSFAENYARYSRAANRRREARDKEYKRLLAREAEETKKASEEASLQRLDLVVAGMSTKELAGIDATLEIDRCQQRIGQAVYNHQTAWQVRIPQARSIVR